MNVCIISCGNMGTTKKAADMLSSMLSGAEVVDGKMSEYLQADVYVLGTNIRFGKFNKNFHKAAKHLSKLDKPVYVYICGAQIERSDFFIDKARKEIQFAKDIRFVWGELVKDGAKGINKFFIESFIDGRQKDGLPKPRLLEKELRALARSILEMA